MSVSTYAELQAACTNFLHRSDLSARIPEFIAFGESRINREVRSRLMEQRVSTTATSQYVSVPGDLLAIRGVRVQGTDIGWLDYITPDQYFNQYASGTASTAKCYTIFGDELIFPGTPSGAVELWYYKRLAALSSAINSLFTRNPDLYLYAAMCAAMPFIGKDAKMPMWEALYAQVRDQINRTEKEGRYPAGMFVRAA